jgi:mono/diheme cytochrome c family protein
MTCPRWCRAGLFGLTLLIVLSCKKSETTPPPGTATGNPPPTFIQLKPPILEVVEPHAAGKRVYNANSCHSCHTVGGATPGPPMPKKGPDLAKVASTPGRDVEWFIAFVGNPKKERPGAKMPAFEGQITPEDMRALAEFLTSLK